MDLSVSQANATANYLYPDLQFSNLQNYLGTNRGSATANPAYSDSDYGAYWVKGTVENTGSQTAQNITVVATYYNSTGAVVAVGLTDAVTPTSIGAGQTATFKVGAYDLNQTNIASNQKIASYVLLAEVIGPVLEGTAPSIAPTSTSGTQTSTAPTPNDTSSTDSTQSSSVNSSSTPTWVYAAIAAVAVVVVVGVFLALKRRKSNPDEDEPAASNKPDAPAAKPHTKPPPKHKRNQ